MIFDFALRNALRNRRRSALTAATICLGCALLTVGLSWVVGVQGSFIDASVRVHGHVRLVNEAYAAREALLPLQDNLPHIAPLQDRLRQIPGIEAIYPRITLPVTASVGGQIGELFGIISGAPLDYYTEVLEFPDRTIDGRSFSYPPVGEAVIGRTLAQNMRARVGEEAIFLGKTQDGSFAPIRVTVVGIVDTGNGLLDKQVFVALEAAQWMADIPEGATELLVFGASASQARALAERIRAVSDELITAGDVVNAQGEQGGVSITAWSAREPFASLLRTARVLMAAVALVIVFITALGVLNTMLMSVLERTAEIGVLRAMGMKTPAVVGMFILEAMMIAIVGGAIGVTLGSGVSIAMEGIGVDLGTAAANLPETVPANRVLHPDWRPLIAAIAFGLGVVMALVGAAAPASRAATIQPITAMRARR